MKVVILTCALLALPAAAAAGGPKTPVEAFRILQGQHQGKPTTQLRLGANHGAAVPRLQRPDLRTVLRGTPPPKTHPTTRTPPPAIHAKHNAAQADQRGGTTAEGWLGRLMRRVRDLW